MIQISEQEYERLKRPAPTPAEIDAAFKAAYQAWRKGIAPTWGRNAARLFFEAGLDLGLSGVCVKTSG